MVVRNASSGPNITAGRMIIAFANAARTANSPSPRFRIYGDELRREWRDQLRFLFLSAMRGRDFREWRPAVTDTWQ